MENNTEMDLKNTILTDFKKTLYDLVIKLESFSGSKSQLQRSIYNIALSPMNTEDLHFSYPIEKEIFDISSKLTDMKLNLMLIGFEEKGYIKILKSFTEEEVKKDEIVADEAKEIVDGSV